jgi:hypothetical protein
MVRWISDKTWSKKKVRLPKNILIAKAKKGKRVVSRSKALAAKAQRP